MGADFADVIARALARERDERWPSMRDFLQALLVACRSLPGDEIRTRHKAVLEPRCPRRAPASTARAMPPPGNRSISVIDLDGSTHLRAPTGW